MDKEKYRIIDELEYFGNYVEYDSEEEFNECELYLKLWKKYLLKMNPDLELVEEWWYKIEHPVVTNMKDEICENILAIKIFCRKR